MKILLYLILLSLPAVSQTTIGSKSFINSLNVVKKDTCVSFRAGGYADYPVKVAKDGSYNFTVQVMNNAAKGTYQYIWSPASGTWSSTYLPLKAMYQSITTKVTVNTSTSYVRLYYPDSVTVNNISYTIDTAAAVDLTPILSRLSALEQKTTALQSQIGQAQKAVDSIPTLYIVPNYGTQANPIKP